MNQQIFELVEFTSRNIFLTGKAGTGKTTFLNDFVKKTKKKYIIVAPTGIAAINAGGSTIHSMFGLPLRPFLPTAERIDSNLGNNISDLLMHFKYRKDKLKLLREVEIIIIDEVSMLRADVLDMMDFSLRHIRRNQQKFGGVQMLFIGDLYQLPPVVRDENVLSKFYNSPFFFSAKALEDINLLTIELTKVYRQKDETFLNILNGIRDGNPRDVDFNLLNSRYLPDFEPKEQSYVYLTSHNKMADSINQEKLNKLTTPSFFFNAKIVGDFKENQYPNDEVLELKVGSQIMFIRNDASGEKKYFNGKLAEITYINEEEIYVMIDGQDEQYKLKKEVWENKKYSLAPDKTIQEEVLGSFEQYPIRLAWAVTIHKSQGLTFDRVIIDAGKSFASGQVYVALSRCRTLEGIVLKSKIIPEIIFNDRRVSGFQDSTNANDKIEEIVSAEKYDYSISKMLNRIDCQWIKTEIHIWNNVANESKKIDRQKVKALHQTIKTEAEQLSEVYDKFQKVIISKTKKFIAGSGEWNEIEQKSKGAVLFFFNQINEKIFEPFKSFYAETKGASGLKAYNEQTRVLVDDLEDYLKDLQDAKLLETPLFDKENKKEISSNVVKIPTHVITWKLFEQGKTIADIAKERGVLSATIIGHLSKFAETGILKLDDLKRIVTKEKIKVFEELHKKETFDNLTDWKKNLPEDFEFGEIRLLWS
ncbi:MAG: helix-turn-helix domain-containing protein, partial [Cruoricaptor ignavus]|nr:helix-turn-helix domain-containing protein [Cruoricaptor ignavus]